MSYADFTAFRRSLGRTPRLERQTVRARGLAFAVWSSPPVAGAEPLVCINGGMIYGHENLWPALSPLAAGRQVILYDQRGRGESEAPADPLASTIHDDAADIGAIRRALGIRRWDVLGHSWGGGIASLGTAADPAGVRRLVLVNAVGPTSEWMPPLRANVLARITGEDRDFVERTTDDVLGQPDPALHSRYNRAVYPAWFGDREMATYFRPPEALSQTGSAVLADLRRNGYDWRVRFRTLAVPSLVLHGELDALPASTADRWIEVLPQGRRALLPRSGHMPFWEEPERFFHLVEAYLASPSPGSVPLPP